MKLFKIGCYQTHSSTTAMLIPALVATATVAANTSAILEKLTTLSPGVPYLWLSKLWSNFGTLNIRCRITIGIQQWTTSLTTTHMVVS